MPQFDCSLLPRCSDYSRLAMSCVHASRDSLAPTRSSFRFVSFRWPINCNDKEYYYCHPVFNCSSDVFAAAACVCMSCIFVQFHVLVCVCVCVYLCWRWRVLHITRGIFAARHLKIWLLLIHVDNSALRRNFQQLRVRTCTLRITTTTTDAHKTITRAIALRSKANELIVLISYVKL